MAQARSFTKLLSDSKEPLLGKIKMISAKRERWNCFIGTGCDVDCEQMLAVGRTEERAIERPLWPESPTKDKCVTGRDFSKLYRSLQTGDPWHKRKSYAASTRIPGNSCNETSPLVLELAARSGSRDGGLSGSWSGYAAKNLKIP